MLGRKVMTNLDSILKSRDIILPTKVCLVKALERPEASGDQGDGAPQRDVSVRVLPSVSATLK